ncbi:DNA cytosine methyltransferase [Campylobacter helveticus]|nr:DNA cytosine methyltransferase [Campylobacter helveticus]
MPNELSKATLYKQIGNSVSVSVIANIAKKIKRAIKNDFRAVC